ncbi:HipA family kinase [Enterobacter bugandensis]|uniref:HipA family kinase n=1 Tax=Enterobacter bugandensis TaxID=881260 RepID=UPI002D79A102|nr:HipA family kinase [Enterobacter bugandensis]WRT51354.1 HipA family kinase [Enterobacter bugandensis]
MIEICAFERSIGDSHSKPFIGLSDSGKRYFVKTYKNEKTSFSLFCDYVSAKLAGKIGLPWVSVHTAHLAKEIQEHESIRNPFVIAFDFIEELNYLDPKHTFTKEQVEFLHGKLVFDNWISISDDKIDTCQIANEKLIFLDAGLAFQSDEVNEEGIIDNWVMSGLEWPPRGMYVESSLYSEDVVIERGYLFPWIDKISEINIEFYRELMSEIPKEWGVPEEYKDKFITVFSSSKEVFASLMRNEINYSKLN